MTAHGRLRDRLEAISSRAQKRSPIVRGVVGVLHRAYVDDVSRNASSMAFDLFLGLVPLLALLGYLAAVAGRAGAKVNFDSRLLDLAPASVAEVWRAQYSRLDGASAIAPISALSFVWIASGASHTALAMVRKIFGASARGYIRTRIFAIGFTIAVVLLAAASSIAALVVSRLASVGFLAGIELDILRTLIGFLSIVATGASVSGLYRLAGGRESIHLRVVPGTIVAVLGFALLSWGFSTYVRTLATYAAFYGGLAAVAMLLFWLWLSSLALLIGAEVNVVATNAKPPHVELRHTHPPEPHDEDA